MNPASIDVADIGDTARGLILRNLLKGKNCSWNPAYSIGRLSQGYSMGIIGDDQQIEAISLAGFTLSTRDKATTAIKLVLHSPRSTIPT